MRFLEGPHYIEFENFMLLGSEKNSQLAIVPIRMNWENMVT